MHCLRQEVDLTWDHVIPLSWYPESTPEDLEKWKVPSCEECNRTYGTLENDLLLRMGLCLDPADARAAGIADKALRAIKPEYAKNEKDRRAREAKRKKILDEKFTIDRNTTGYFPGFGPGDNPPSRTAILISQDALRRFGEKLARGITYLETGELIADEYRVQVAFVHDHDVGRVEEIFRRHATRTFRGPGVLVERAALRDEPVTALFRITLWGRFKSYLSVHPKALARQYGLE